MLPESAASVGHFAEKPNDPVGCFSVQHTNKSLILLILRAPFLGTNVLRSVYSSET